MRQFQSNIQTATQISTKMESACDKIYSATSHSITKAMRTTLSVNSKAQEANQQVLELTRQVSTAFQQAVDTIHSVAKEFEKMDSVLQNTFR